MGTMAQTVKQKQSVTSGPHKGTIWHMGTVWGKAGAHFY